MKTLQGYLAVACVLGVACAIYFSLRDVPLPDVSQVDRAIREAAPRQEISDARAFTTTIKGYTYSLTPRAAYDIVGLVVSQHRGDAFFTKAAPARCLYTDGDLR